MTMAMRVVLCDLDDTLFDHDRATRTALARLREEEPTFACWTLDELDARHRALLELLHVDVLARRISPDDARVERFRRLLEAAAGGQEHGARAAQAAVVYRRTYETAWYPVPGAVDLLALIKSRGLSAVIVTNNNIEEQQQKLDRLGLTTYVDWLVASEEVGCCKPEAEIFHIALARARAAVDEAVMLGDAWAADIEGAKGVGIRAVWLNRFGAVAPDPEVPELRTLDPVADAFRVLAGGS